MGKLNLRIFDDGVAEVFEAFGGKDTALYFEAVRYRQQLFRGKSFTFRSKDIRQRTGLSYQKQRLACQVLSATGWIESAVTSKGKEFKITSQGYDLTKYTKRRRDVREIYKTHAQLFA